ncbi:ATP-binding protein [Allosalinactinospora lopnorensis]|uniref:ATP-binding protein n=1 Tax=Allosalinactinospora lopnorensis TaxID=1352348 RepID=UPI000623E4FB|nr:AAA family ATPase [Allosalinactinospora lopnorensis]
MPLTERVEERDLLLNLFKECTDGKGSAVLVTGTEGYGKTELLNNFISYAGQQGALTLQATCSPIEKEIPLIAIGQLLNSTETPDELADETAEFLKLRKETLSNGNTHPNSIQKPVEVIEGFHRLLSRISDHTPLVIAVDDIHYVDIPSLQCLLHFIRHMRTSRTLIVMTESPSISTVHPLFHSDLLSQQHCHQANLHPLTNDGVYTIITRELGDSTEFKLKVEFVRASGGNPILLHALIKDYRSAGSGADDNIVIGPSFRQAVTTILHRIDRSLIRAAQGLALLSESDSVALLDRLLRISSGTASRALQTLTDIGLVSNGAFRHPLVGEALLDELSAEERKDMHHRVARLLHIHGTPPSMVAAHLLTAGPVDAPWAIPVLREASEQALADNDRELSVRLLNLAHQIHPDKAAGASIRALLLENTWGLGSRTIRERLSALAADLREGYLNTRHAFLLARHLVWNGQANKVLDVLASLRKRAENGDPDAADEIDVIRTWLSCTQPQILGQGSTEPYPPHPTPMQDTRLLAPTLLRSALDSGPRDVPIGDVERTLRCSNLTEEGCSVTISALRSLIYTDRVDQALVWCDQLLRESVRIGRPEFGAFCAPFRQRDWSAEGISAARTTARWRA